jgi:hypothetical protein
MTNWKSPAELAHDAAAFGNFMHVLAGLYIWEFVTSLPFDWSFITGRRVFKWPMIFYFLGRYSLLGALVGILVALNVTEEVDCQALYTFNQVVGNAAIGAASINLSIRTIAVWSQNKWIIYPIVAVILGHWSLLLHGILLKAIWVEGAGCEIVQTDNKILAASFIYTMSFDFIVLSLTAIKLAFAPSGRSRLVTLIFQDGLIYFVIAFCANALATVFMLLNLNAVMSIIFNVPAAVASTIMACRAVRRLTKFSTAQAEVYQQSSHGATSGLAFRSTHGTRGQSGMVSFGPKKPVQSGVHVQMDTFTMPDPHPEGGESFLEYDVNGNVKSTRTASDHEAQEISEDFKRPPYY